MSWPLAAALLLGLALVAGFGWYERARPDARVVALVATLAALGALGRIAFAAVPNVKPTTDIVLIAGFTLGGGPGFAVGALAGLTSNFFFGQGPWTPWQMAAWGATGVLGALLARVSARRGRTPRIGRLRLAVICGLAGGAFTAVQDVGDWVTYSDHSAGQLGAYVASGLGFDAVHALGCVAFALLIGPALIGAIQRFTRRLQVRWIAPGAVFPPLALAAAVVLTVAPGGPAPARGAGLPPSPMRYLVGAQNADGGFGAAVGQGSDSLFSGWAALGLAAAGRSPVAAGRAGRSVIDYTRATTGAHLDTGSLERTILVLGAAGVRATQFAGQDLVAALQARRRGDGSTGATVNLTAFAVLALRSARLAPSSATIAWLDRQQNGDGGFGFGGAGSPSDIDDTGAVLEALAGEPAAASVRARAVAFLRRHQNRDGGFPSQPGMSSNAQSTAWAIQGLIAAGTSPTGLHRDGAPAPAAYLQSLIQPNGSVAYARGDVETPVWVTGEALMALVGRPLPVPALPAPVPAPLPAASHHRAAPRPHRAAAPAAGARHTHREARRARRHGHPLSSESAAARALAPVIDRWAGRAGAAVAALLAPLGVG